MAFLLFPSNVLVPDINTSIYETNPFHSKERENKELYVCCEKRSLGGEFPEGQVG